MSLFGSKKPKMSQEEFDRKMREADARDAARGPAVDRGGAAAGDFSVGQPPKPTVTENATPPAAKGLQNINDYSKGSAGIGRVERELEKAK